MRYVACALLLVACTEHGKGGGEPWDVRVVELANAICDHPCVPSDQKDNCVVDVFADMDQARTEIGPAGEDACEECMRVLADVAREITAPECMPTSAQNAEVEAACGPGNQVCAGFP
jgi:hypothetical protein